MQNISNGLLRISTIIRKSHIFHPTDTVIGEIWDENNVTKSQRLPAHDRWQSKLACKQAGFFFSRKC